MRLNWQSKMRPSTRTSSVLAVPGIPSMSTCPPANRQTSTCSITSSWPTMTLAISRRADSNRFPIESSMEEFISGGLQFVEGLEEAVLVGAGRDRFSGQQADEPAAADGPAAV